MFLAHGLRNLASLCVDSTTLSFFSDSDEETSVAMRDSYMLKLFGFFADIFFLDEQRKPNGQGNVQQVSE